jgi:TonB family protein
MKPTTTPADEADEEADADAYADAEKKIPKAILAKEEPVSEDGDGVDKPIKKAIAAHGGSGDGTSSDKDAHGSGPGNASEFGWYGNMLHDRFYSEWIQPTTSVSSNSKIAVLVRLRIEKDGRVSSFEIVKPSGNVMIDESVSAIAKHVRQVDPLPAGLGKGGHYDVKINFELNSEQ